MRTGSALCTVPYLQYRRNSIKCGDIKFAVSRPGDIPSADKVYRDKKSEW
jgi:hypothetical protein